MNLLNRRLIDEIRSHLRSMDWEPREYKSNYLKFLLKGAQLALYDKNIMLHLCSENNKAPFYVSVETYNDPMNGTEKKEIGRIYTNRTEKY